MYIDGNRKRRQNVSRSLTRSSPSSTLQPLPSQIKARMHDPLRSAPSSFGRPVTCAFQVSIRHLLDPGPAIKLAASSGRHTCREPPSELPPLAAQAAALSSLGSPGAQANRGRGRSLMPSLPAAPALPALKSCASATRRSALSRLRWLLFARVRERRWSCDLYGRPPRHRRRSSAASMGSFVADAR